MKPVLETVYDLNTECFFSKPGSVASASMLTVSGPVVILVTLCSSILGSHLRLRSHMQGSKMQINVALVKSASADSPPPSPRVLRPGLPAGINVESFEGSPGTEDLVLSRTASVDDPSTASDFANVTLKTTNSNRNICNQPCERLCLMSLVLTPKYDIFGVGEQTIQAPSTNRRSWERAVPRCMAATTSPEITAL